MLYGNINYLKFRDIIKLSCAPPTNPRPVPMAGQGTGMSVKGWFPKGEYVG